MTPQNIYIVGAQCTGKTTLVNALEAHYKANEPPEGQPAIIKEVARTVLVQYSFTAHDITSSTERCLALQKLILQVQLREEKRALESGAQWFISDRSGIDPIAYALQYVGQEGANVLLGSPEWAELKKRMQASLIVVCEAGVSWLRDDGVRLMPANTEEWGEFHELFCALLRREGLAFVTLSRAISDISERVQASVGAVGAASNHTVNQPLD
ncbi:AAA domain-containing protein [Cercophora newfieldiana]|uniref:AAA domain-containing protein n=1 Tax=Cercophora newfieldiana TaxID=92897 RepID=A0AA40CRC0_9PEZI|nr:AAA domain-containing protein [Cercophora newfieldiana]